VHKTDMVQHYGAMRDVAALAAEKGLKLCIDGLDWRDFDYLNLERIRPHFIKVGWSNDLLSSDPEQLAVFVQAVRRNPGTQVVMSRCDNAKAFPFARTLGVNYVQGKLADQMFKTGFKM
jgi:EAL domain-containing protein (putative c-di-GMP-specific phosphodiesterase class I)